MRTLEHLLARPVPARSFRGHAPIILAALLALFGNPATSLARGGVGPDPRLASRQIEALPRAIRRDLAPLERACGGLRAEAHFTRHLAPGSATPQFIALHFDNIGCNNRDAVCTPTGCIHRVYVSSGTGYRLVFDAHVEDLELTMIGGTPAIRLHCTGFNPDCMRVLRWTGSRFEDQRPLPGRSPARAP